MANTDLILEVLDEISPNGYCDDCLSRELGIQPRQQVNRLGNRLFVDGKILRKKESCLSCKKLKITNSISKATLPSQGIIAKPGREDTILQTTSPRSTQTQPIDIENIRTQIVRICHRLWDSNKKESPPRNISVIINTLRSDNLLPSHQANMMLTVCNLRNVYVYENMELGQRELEITKNAWAIIGEWWSKNNSEG